MAESEKVTPSRELLEERIIELEEINKQLEIRVLECQYRLREKNAPQEITLKEYIAKLKSKKPEGKFVLTDVTLDSFCEKYDGWTIAMTVAAGIMVPIIMWYFIPDFVRHWKYATINLSDNDGNSLGFKYFPKGNSRVLEQLEQNFVGHKVRPVVMSYSYKYRFIEGVMQENGKYQSLDNL